MKKLKKYFSSPRQIFLAIFLVVLSFSFIFNHQLLAEDSLKDDYDELNQKIQEYEQKIGELQGEQKTLASTISYLNNKIQLTATQIAVTEQELEILVKEIASLSGKIEILDKSISDVSTILSSRIEATYKRGKIKSVYLFFSSQGFSEFLSRIQYLKVAQLHDRQLLFEMQKSKMNYDSQKELKEEKQVEQERLQKQLVSQKVALAQQKQSKQNLLEVTKNDEKKFQELLAVARAEIEAIQAILAGKGEETKVGDVKKGERIAYLIQGSSCNSDGTHLHFIIANNDGTPFNPFNYLKSVDHKNCSGPGECSPADSFNPSGDWDWPLNPQIILSQGYGETWAIENTWVGRIYSFHNGIDIIGSSNDVKAVKDGVLYRGSYTGRNGCLLPYVRVEHKDSDIHTYFLHVY